MNKIDRLMYAMQAVLTTAADHAASKSGFVKRRSKITGAAFAQILVFGWLSNPAATLLELAQTAAAGGLHISPQALDQRFTRAAAEHMRLVLETAVHMMVKAGPADLRLLSRFAGVYVLDSSTISLPAELTEVWEGCGGSTPEAGAAAMKMHVQLDISNGGLCGPELTAGRVQDKDADLHHAELPAGALCIRDLGYFSIQRLGEMSADRVYWLMRLHPQAALLDETGERLEPADLLSGQRADEIDMPVLLGAKKQVACRLIAVRMPEDVAAERRRRMKAEAKREGQTVSRRRLVYAGWSLLITNAPSDLMSVSEAGALYRARWQIELLFKLWKSQGRIDGWRSQKPWRVLCEVYAKLVVMVVQHWVLLTACWAYPDRSLHKASGMLRRHAPTLAFSFHRPERLREALRFICSCIGATCRINKRRDRPHNYQILQECSSNSTAWAYAA